MNNLKWVWMPAGELSKFQRLALAVEAKEKPTPDLWRSLLATQFQQMVDEDPEAAKRALEMSQEQAPELWSIAEQSPTNEWGQQLTNSEGAGRMAQLIDWSLPGSLSQEEPLDLQSVLEMIA